MKLKVLVACEESQAVCKAFRELGHDAYSCDIQPCSGGHPEWHIQCDVLGLLKDDWDLIIAHPPCTDLAVSGARWFKKKQETFQQQKSIDFFMEFTKLTWIDHVAIENPVSIMSTIYRKPDQIIQPYEYGHPVSKATCLWLKGLPLLKPTNIVKPGTKDKYGFTDGEALQMVRDENGKILSWNDPRTKKYVPKHFQVLQRQWQRNGVNIS